MRYILPFILFLCIKSYGVVTAPQLLRACINFDDSTVTVKWKPPTDACGSFTEYHLYGSENSGPYVLLDKIPNIAISEYPHKLLDQNTNWSYYITVLNLCDGLDSATSSSLTIDVTYPTNIQLDSVSYSIVNQDIIAGWTKNPSIDTRGYEIYDFSSGNGDSIGATNLTRFTISQNPSTRFPIVLATLDSCSLSSLISRPHLPVFLSGTIDTCLREINLTWPLYKGWTIIDSQSLYTSFNNSPYIKDTTVNGSIQGLVFSKFQLGDTFEFYLRSYTSSGTITSSSNKIKFQTRKLEVPTHLYLDYVTVDSDNLKQVVLLSWNSDNLFDIKGFDISRGDNPSTLLYQNSIPKTANAVSYQTYDLTSTPELKSHTYQISAINKCDEIALNSNISSSIFLSLKPTIEHNSYTGWDVGVDSYTLQKESSSTWNLLYTSLTPFGFTDFLDSTGCYRVQATETQNQWNGVAHSWSNKVCLLDKLQAYITTAINPKTENNRFVVKGKGIDHAKSYYQIFNRWGEQIVHRSTQDSWDATYKGEPVPPGTYVYLVILYGVLGETEIQKGTVYVLR